ncbi:MAG: ATP-dependent DNA helicase, partial [Rhodospirillales bacterium]|nr:ATP-dependent DNA helicase [Rhodospirillales bacterium]
RSRARGLKARIGDLLADEKGNEALDAVLHAATALPGPAWHQRIGGGQPVGPAEAFLALVRQQVHARDPDAHSAYGLEAPVLPTVPGLLEAADELEEALDAMIVPLRGLLKSLAGLLDVEADQLDSGTRARIEAARRSLERRGLMQAQAWKAMLRSLAEEPPTDFVDWFGVERREGRDVDVGMHRHWIDPVRPFTETVLRPAHGALITSATLRDSNKRGAGEAWGVAEGWDSADDRTGARHLSAPAIHVGVPSPFDYAAQTKVIVVNDIGRNDADQIATAYRELFLAAGGGGLGLFTAISRLRAVHQRIAPALDSAGVHLLAQHVDTLDTGTLIDIFRAEEHTCLLGTDAVRDGVDVPGRSLRLIVFDRVPWPRPTILHKARKQAHAAQGNSGYDDMLTRLKLKQAYGRLIRRADDTGVFVMLDRMMPSRLLDAFPEGVEVQRIGLADAIAETRAFLNEENQSK